MSFDILIVDDESDIRNLIKGLLDDEGYNSRLAADAHQAYAAIKENPPAVIILDIWLHGSEHDGLEILKNIKENALEIPVIMISGHGTIETAVSAIKMGAYDFIEKPFKSDRLLFMVKRALETANLKKENRALKQKAGSPDIMIGNSAPMQDVHQMIERVAPTNSRILITGEPGTGKNIAARVIHKMSRRADKPFFTLNCASLRPKTIESELFGTEGHSGKTGLLEKANGGTVLLDEVADMPLETQGRIVRLLQEQRFQKSGSDKKILIDVRIIASSSCDLHDFMQKGLFRQDLYYRLNVVPLQVPPLRERMQDIPAMISHFTDTISEQSGLPKQTFSDEALALMKAYEWPGNVRQLHNVVEWTMIMNSRNQSHSIEADDLPPEIAHSGKVFLPPFPDTDRHGEDIVSLPLKKARARFEKDYLLSQINRFDGNISKTAEFIGMERSALHRKMKSLQILNDDKPVLGNQKTSNNNTKKHLKTRNS